MPSFFGEREADIVTVMPQPVERTLERDGSVTHIGGSPPEVIVRVCRADVEVAGYSFEWEGPYSGRIVPIRVRAASWSAVPQENAMMPIEALITVARNYRRSRFRTCRLCSLSHPPDWMHEEEVCQGCAERSRPERCN